MRIGQSAQDALEQMLRDQWTPEQLRKRKRQYDEVNLSTTRYLFDLFYMIPTGPRQKWVDAVYADPKNNDSHIETALRRAVKKICD